jgi:hypothetical protein
MSQTTEEAEPNPIAHIPAILTNSAMEILEFYGEDIIEITATGTSRTTNRTALIEDVNLNRTIATQKEVELDYRRITKRTGEVENPLNQDVIDQIRQKLRTKLYPSSLEVEPDMSVERVKVDAKIPRLEEETRARSDEFELTFVSDPVESDGYRRETELSNSGKGLYTEMKFNYQNLHLRKVEEVEAKYSQQSNPQIMSWNGVKDIRPVGYKSTASQAIAEKALPPAFADTKPYMIGEEEFMELIDSDELESDEDEDDDSDDNE